MDLRFHVYLMKTAILKAFFVAVPVSLQNLGITLFSLQFPFRCENYKTLPHF